MATDALSYTGINRAVSDFAGAKACEELINLRPATEGTVPVKDFSVKLADMPFRRVFVHYTTDGPHYIVLKVVGDDAYVQYVDEDGALVKTLYNTEWYGDQTVDSLHFASAGNILLVSHCDRDNHKYENRAYTWKDGAYQSMEAQVPSDFSFDVTDGSAAVEATVDIATIAAGADKIDVASSVETGLNALQERNPELCIGPVIVAVAFKTKDGSTFWTNGWRVYDPEPILRGLSGRYKNASYSWWANTAGLYAGFYAEHPDGGYVLSGLQFESAELGQVTRITVPGTNVKVTIDSVSDWDEETSVIQSVEVYSSRPIPYLDADAAGDGFAVSPAPQLAAALIVPKADYGAMDLAGQLLYHQASIPMASLAESPQEVTLRFGGNIQVTEDTLDADAGAVERYGRLLSYNARFHYWDSVSKLTVSMPYFQQPGSASLRQTADVFVRYADLEREGLYYAGEAELIPSATVESDSTMAVVASSINVKEVVVLFGDGPWHVERYRMQASTTYNYSIHIGGPYSTEDPLIQQFVQDLLDAKDGGGEIYADEPAAINVTEQYNPFVFRVEHSYLAPGNVLDVQPQMAGITDASYGRDPLSVFTERGTYALTQGSANVLYGAFLPVSPTVISRKGGGGALPTDMGIFYLGDGALWLLAGRRSTLVSDALHLGPHKQIRPCPGYKRISGGGTATPEYDVSALVSQVTFEEFVRTGGRLSFNRFRMELLVSNPLYGYTYVLSLKYRQWFKIGRRIWQDEAGSDIASTPGETPGNIDVLDLATEEATAQVLVHMQTRPFSMAYRHIHMHRAVAMVRSRLSSSAGDKLVVGLYGSDDLQNWRLLAYSKRNGGSGTLDISQIRTTPSARSWRYYTVCIGGPVSPDSDFGPVLVDYEPVIRRIG